MDLDSTTGLKNTRARINKMAPWIGTKFRNQRLLTKQELIRNLSTLEKELVEWFYTVKPARFGVKSQFYGLEEPTDESQFVKLERTLFSLNNQPVPDVQYVPAQLHMAFVTMSQHLESEIAGRIKLSSAYRSPAFQVLLICYNVKKNNFDLSKTLSLVSLPGYSEHGLIKTGAIDVQLAEQQYVRADTAQAFAESKEYGWMLKRAESFGFKLSYPKDNELGVPFEPWHWRYWGN